MNPDNYENVGLLLHNEAQKETNVELSFTWMLLIIPLTNCDCKFMATQPCSEKSRVTRAIL